MTTLTDFLLARYAEIEAIARQVITEGDADELGRWEWVEYPYEGGSPQPLGALAKGTSGYDPDWTWVQLVNRHDPAYVLAECESKRRIVAIAADQIRLGREARGWDNWEDMANQTLLALALPFADHPDYREEWRP
jgi:hypothetical protein